MRSLLILFSSVFIISCNSKPVKTSGIIEKKDNSNTSFTNKELEKLFPIEKGIEKFDTLISDKQIRITITKRDLDSYVIHESWGADGKHLDRYRDAEIVLKIKQESQVLLDTVFRKEQFLKSAGKEFLDIAIFQNYWFKKLDKNRVELFGVIGEPETDWAVAFNHYFDLKEKTLKFVEEKSDDE